MSTIMLVIAALVACLFLFIAVAPLEVLGWYAGWFNEGEAWRASTSTSEALPATLSPAVAGSSSGPAGHEIASDAVQQDLGHEDAAKNDPLQNDPAHPPASHYLIYLSGIGAIAAKSIPQEEEPFIAALQETLPTTHVISDIFPYSVTNLGLTGQRVTARIWDSIERMRLKNPDAALAFLVNARNLIQMAISADPRYGPIYNGGVARELVEGLLQHGYRIGSGVPVTLLGWSAGVQIALGASWYLPNMIGAPVYVISIGGVMADDRGIERIQHLWHMWGDKDHLSPLAKVLYAGRWKIFPKSIWNRALAAGKITLIPLGPLRHNGQGNYFDNQTQFANGETNMQHVLGLIKQALVEAGLVSG